MKQPWNEMKGLPATSQPLDLNLESSPICGPRGRTTFAARSACRLFRTQGERASEKREEEARRALSRTVPYIYFPSLFCAGRKTRRPAVISPLFLPYTPHPLPPPLSSLLISLLRPGSLAPSLSGSNDLCCSFLVQEAGGFVRGKTSGHVLS